jgi:antitoxin HicB
MPSRTKRESSMKRSPRRARHVPDAREFQLVVRWSDEDRCFLAWAPALPGCITHGETPEAAARSGLEAMALWIEDADRRGDPLPRPVRRLSGKMTLRLPTSMHASIADAAERDGVSLNQWIVTKLASQLEPLAR